MAFAAIVAGPADAKSKSKAKAKNTPGHFVFTQTNDPGGNQVVVFKRNTSTGKITQFKTVDTGGKGTASQPPFGLPNVDSANSVTLTPNRKLLYVVNSGDNSVTSFKVSASGIKRTDRVSSGGVMPVSVAAHGKLVYVLNGLSGNVFGYRSSSSGKLKQITNSSQALSTVGPDGIAAALEFSPDGTWLVATERYLPLHEGTNGQPGIIDRFRIAGDGSASPVIGSAAATPTPFGFDFTSEGILVTSSAGIVNTVNNSPPPITDGTQMNGSAQSYSISSTGALTPISNADANGRATCWLVVTKNGKWAFATNTASAKSANPQPGNPIGTGQNGLSRFSVDDAGSLALVDNADTGGPGFAGDLWLSPDQKFLYVGVSSLGIIGDAISHVDVYEVGSDGSLTLVMATPATLPAGTSGMAVS